MSQITGNGPWSRQARHQERVREIQQSLPTVLKAIYGPEGPKGLDYWAATYWLLLSESKPVHYLGPRHRAPTRRPDWWIAAGLPDRRHRQSGDAWNAAAREAAELQLQKFLELKEIGCIDASVDITDVSWADRIANSLGIGYDRLSLMAYVCQLLSDLQRWEELAEWEEDLMEQVEFAFPS